MVEYQYVILPTVASPKTNGCKRPKLRPTDRPGGPPHHRLRIREPGSNYFAGPETWSFL